MSKEPVPYHVHERLLDENERLLDLLAVYQVKEGDVTFNVALNLTRSEGILLSYIYKNDFAKHFQLWAHTKDVKFNARAKCLIRVRIKSIRDKVKPFGILIINHRANGYYVDTETKALLKKYIVEGA